MSPTVLASARRSRLVVLVSLKRRLPAPTMGGVHLEVEGIDEIVSISACASCGLPWTRLSPRPAV